MGASEIEVQPDRVSALSGDVRAIHDKLNTILTTLQADLPAGEPWGTNDGGAQFGASYQPNHTNVIDMMTNAIQVLDSIATGHDTAGKSLARTDDASAS